MSLGNDGLYDEKFNKIGLYVSGLLKEHLDESLSREQATRLDRLLKKSKKSGNQFAKEHWGIDDAYGMDPIELRTAIDAAEEKQQLG